RDTPFVGRWPMRRRVHIEVSSVREGMVALIADRVNRPIVGCASPDDLVVCRSTPYNGVRMRIRDFRIHPIAIADPPLRSSYGLHAPYALRTIVELIGDDNVIGISETYGGEAQV